MFKKMYIFCFCVIACFFSNTQANRCKTLDTRVFENLTSCDVKDIQAFCEQLSVNEKRELQESFLRVCDELVEKCDAHFVTRCERYFFNTILCGLAVAGVAVGLTQSYLGLSLVLASGAGVLKYSFYLDGKDGRIYARQRSE